MNYKKTCSVILAIQGLALSSSNGATLATNNFSNVFDSTGVSANGHIGLTTAKSDWSFTGGSFTGDNIFTSNFAYRATTADSGTKDTTSKALSPNRNVENDGSWTITWTLTTGSSDLLLDNFSFDSYRTNSGRTLQSFTGDSANLFTAKFDIATGGSSIFGSTPVSQSITTDGATAAEGNDSVLSLTGTTLTANTAYTFSLTAEALADVGGYFVDVDTFSINGTVVPEPSSSALLGLAVFSLAFRRQRK